MPRLLAGSCVLLAVGATLVLSEMRWFSRQPLVERLRPYGPGGLDRSASRGGMLSVASFREVIGPLARGVGERLAGLLGVSEDVEVRLRRIHARAGCDHVPSASARLGRDRVRRGRCSSPPPRSRPSGSRCCSCSAARVLAFLIVEQQLAASSDQWKRRIFLELPGGERAARHAHRCRLLARRGAEPPRRARLTVPARPDLAGVCGRIRQGLTEVDALREWATIADVDALDRLVAVLALNREAGDLGRLVADEARSIRRDVQRELIEQIERRGAAGLDPRDGCDPRAGRGVAGGPLHRGAASVLHHLTAAPMQHRKEGPMLQILRDRYVGFVAWWSSPPARGRGERGEGVISAAIAVLIMAGIGALMWVGFKTIWEDTEDNTRDKVTEIGE